MYKLLLLPGLIFYLSAGLTVHAAAISDNVQKPVKEAISLYQETQQQEERWRDEKQILAAEYEALLQAQEKLSRQEKELTIHNKASMERISEKELKISRMQQITTRIEPFLENLTAQLEQMISTDSPFLLEERRRRLKKLRLTLNDPDITVSEKFRKVTESLFVEAEYGQTIEVYQETVPIEGRQRLVNILRLGRIGLFYQSLDQTDCGHYNVAQKKWLPLPNRYNPGIEAAIEMGAKRRPIELLSLPIGRISVP